MREFEVVGSCVTIRYGELLLNTEQVSARRHALQNTDDPDVFKVLKPVHFIQGERFGYAGPELSDAVQMHLDESELGEPKETAKDKALAEINPDMDVSVVLLKDALEQKNIKDTCALLGEKYGVKVTKGADTVSPELFAKIAEDYGFEFDEEPLNP